MYLVDLIIFKLVCPFRSLYDALKTIGSAESHKKNRASKMPGSPKNHIILPHHFFEAAFDATDSTMNPSFSITIPVRRFP